MDQAPEEAATVLGAVRRALHDAAGDLSSDAVLQHLVDTARELVSARYAALGVPDGDGGFAQFITAGMDPRLVDALGPLPRTHGMLGAMLDDPAPFRTPDIHQDPRFSGWWPARHPDMHSFLGYPLMFKGDIVGAFYLTDKVGAPAFTEQDQRLVGEFAAHAAVLIELSRLYNESRELSVAEERSRMARELHDSLTQDLFALRLALRTASLALVGDDGTAPASPAQVVEAREQLERGTKLLEGAFDQVRALVWDLRPPDLERDRLSGVLAKQLAVLERTSDMATDLVTVPEADELADNRAHQVLRVAQEAITNAARHAHAGRLVVTLSVGGGPMLRLVVQDDGVGFDPARPAIRSRRLGLTSMQERARSLAGQLTIDSAKGEGTTITLEVPVD